VRRRGRGGVGGGDAEERGALRARLRVEGGCFLARGLDAAGRLDLEFDRRVRTGRAQPGRPEAGVQRHRAGGRVGAGGGHQGCARAASRASLSSPALGAKSVVVGELDLACNAVGPEGARALGSALDDGVAKLDLGNNAILCAGAKELARALVTNAATTELCLAGNEIKAEGAWWIAEFFAKTKRVSRLSTLDLGSNAVGDAGACDLAEEFGECGSLRHLDLRRNDITNVGATSFCEAFRKLDEAAARKQEHPGLLRFSQPPRLRCVCAATPWTRRARPPSVKDSGFE